MAFRGWKVEALEFFEGLEVDNSSPTGRRTRACTTTWSGLRWRSCSPSSNPTSARAGSSGPTAISGSARTSLPYKTAIGATVGDGYVQLDARGLAAGSGMWMAPDQLERYRVAVADDRSGSKIERIVSSA